MTNKIRVTYNDGDAGYATDTLADAERDIRRKYPSARITNHGEPVLFSFLPGDDEPVASIEIDE